MAGQVGSGYLDPTRQGLYPTRSAALVNIPDPTQPDPTRGSTRPGNNSDLMSASLPYPHNGCHRRLAKLGVVVTKDRPVVLDTTRPQSQGLLSSFVWSKNSLKAQIL